MVRENIGMEMDGIHEVSPQGDSGRFAKEILREGRSIDEDLAGSHDLGPVSRLAEFNENVSDGEENPETQH